LVAVDDSRAWQFSQFETLSRDDPAARRFPLSAGTTTTIPQPLVVTTPELRELFANVGHRPFPGGIFGDIA
jgi:hypothetical protein